MEETFYIIVPKSNLKSKVIPYCGILCLKAGFQGGQYYSSKLVAEEHLNALNAVKDDFELAEVTDENFV